MKLRSKDIINALFATLGYRVEPIRTKNTPHTLASDPFLAQQGLIERLGIKSPIIFDVGANKGDTAAEYLSLFPNATVYCFEPFPETLDLLNQRFAGNEHVAIVPKAVSTEAGTTTFFVNHAAATNSLLPRPAKSKRFYPKNARSKGEIEVQTIDLDSYCHGLDIDRINILKLDIQGGELMAIGGAERMLGEQCVDVVYCEIQFAPLYEGAAQFDGVWVKMRELGYSLFDIYDLHRSAGGQIVYGDAMFVSQRVKEQVISRLAVDR